MSGLLAFFFCLMGCVNSGVIPVVWTNLSSNAQASGSTLSQIVSGPTNDGGQSVRSVASGNLIASFVFQRGGTAGYYLQYGFTGPGWNPVTPYFSDFNWQYFDTTNKITAMENNVGKSADFTVSNGDLLSVEISSGVVYFKQNGTVKYTSATAPNYPAKAAAAIFQGASIAGAAFY